MIKNLNDDALEAERDVFVFFNGGSLTLYKCIYDITSIGINLWILYRISTILDRYNKLELFLKSRMIDRKAR